MKCVNDSDESVQRWVAECTAGCSVRLKKSWNVKTGSERAVWECTLATNTEELQAMLVTFRPGSLETLNTSLAPEQAAEKCYYAMLELPQLVIPTPRVLGHAAVSAEAALL